MIDILTKIQKYSFLFEELVKRDFKKKYKRTVLGMAWSVLAPLLNLLIMWLVFTRFFGNGIPHYPIYLFSGNIVYSYFSEATGQGMTVLVDNAAIYTKINIPKYMFLLSKNVQTLINFGLTILVFFLLCIIDGVPFSLRFILLLFPIVMLLFFNAGLGLILSALHVFFRDMSYLWSVFLTLLTYLSAIFYSIDGFSPSIQFMFHLNPVFLFIRYFRMIVIDATVPPLWFHLLIVLYTVIAVALGSLMYKKYNHKFLYYV